MSSTTTPTSNSPAGLREALGQVIAELRREWRREREAIESEMRAALSELRARVAEERAMFATVDGKASLSATLDKIRDVALEAHAMAISENRAKTDAHLKGLDLMLAAVKDFRPLTVRGTWAKLATYHQHDVVALNGASFIAKRDKPGPCPGDGWQLLAAQGKRERPPAVTDLSISDQGMLTLKNSDGTMVKLDLYPVLSRMAGGRSTA